MTSLQPPIELATAQNTKKTSVAIYLDQTFALIARSIVIPKLDPGVNRVPIHGFGKVCRLQINFPIAVGRLRQHDHVKLRSFFLMDSNETQKEDVNFSSGSTDRVDGNTLRLWESPEFFNKNLHAKSPPPYKVHILMDNQSGRVIDNLPVTLSYRIDDVFSDVKIVAKLNGSASHVDLSYFVKYWNFSGEYIPNTDVRFAFEDVSEKGPENVRLTDPETPMGELRSMLPKDHGSNDGPRAAEYDDWLPKEQPEEGVHKLEIKSSAGVSLSFQCNIPTSTGSEQGFKGEEPRASFILPLRMPRPRDGLTSVFHQLPGDSSLHVTRSALDLGSMMSIRDFWKERQTAVWGDAMVSKTPGGVTTGWVQHELDGRSPVTVNFGVEYSTPAERKLPAPRIKVASGHDGDGRYLQNITFTKDPTSEEVTGFRFTVPNIQAHERVEFVIEYEQQAGV